MPSDFARLISGIERETREDGLRAVRELEQFRDEFRLAAVRIDISLLGCESFVTVVDA
jgi:hypothetical protein